MTVGAWIPSAGDDLVPRIHRAVADFVADAGVERAWVLVELEDGARYPLEALLAEPGSGFVTLVPHREDDDTPERMIVPIAAIRRSSSRGRRSSGRGSASSRPLLTSQGTISVPFIPNAACPWTVQM